MGTWLVRTGLSARVVFNITPTARDLRSLLPVPAARLGLGLLLVLLVLVPSLLLLLLLLPM